VLRQFFTDEQLLSMTPRINPLQSTGLDYYPLTSPGERFPVADPKLPPRLTPRPRDPVRFFQGILEGIAEIEVLGYKKLQELGASYPRSICTVGGGAVNASWSMIRERRLGVRLHSARHLEAAYGAALLARSGFDTRND
jgi:sugar (pentulose or hexulose) kinase